MDPMTDPAARPASEAVPAKPWWRSRTIWLNAVSLIATLAAGYGIEIDAETQAQIVTGVLAIVNVANIALRAVTDKAVK